MPEDSEEPRLPRRLGPKTPQPADAIDPEEALSTFKPSPKRPGPAPPRKPRPETTEPDTSTFSAAPKKSAGKPRSDRDPLPVSGGPGWVERIVFGRVSTGHLAQFCRQFATYLSSGVDLLRSLDNLQKQFARSALGPVISRLAMNVRRGDNLSDAMGREPQAFDSQFLAMMSVAEARGGVPETLKMMAAGYEARQRLLRYARSAMIYPIAVVTIAFGVGMLLTLFVLPGLISILEDTVNTRGGLSLPLPTRILIAFNRFMMAIGWLLVPLGLVGSVFGGIWLYRQPRGKAFLDSVVIYVPVLGNLLKLVDTTRFARTLGVLLNAGVEIGNSLDLTANVMHLVPFRKAVSDARTDVMKGSDLSEALDASHRFSPEVIAIINSGEETGNLPESLDRMADDYEERVESMVKNLGSLIQPILFVFLGGVVLFIAVAFLMAYLQVIAGLGG